MLVRVFVLIFIQDIGKIVYLFPEPACLHVQIKEEGKKKWQGRTQQAGNTEDVCKMVLWQLCSPFSGIFLNEYLCSDFYGLYDNVFNFYLCKYFTCELLSRKQNRFCC